MHSFLYIESYQRRVEYQAGDALLRSTEDRSYALLFPESGKQRMDRKTRGHNEQILNGNRNLHTSENCMVLEEAKPIKDPAETFAGNWRQRRPT